QRHPPRAGRGPVELAGGAAAPARSADGLAGRLDSRRAGLEMSTFAYKALDPTGTTVQGEIEAEDKVAVASQLRSRGLIVVDIDEHAAPGAGDLFARFKKVKPDELTVMTRQFSTMVSSGMAMPRALYVLERQSQNANPKE